MWRCIRAVIKFLNCAVYFPDDNSEKYPGILYPGDMTVYRVLFQGIYYTFGLYFTTFGSLVSHLFRRRLYYFHRHQVDKLLPLIICWPFGAIMGAIIGHEPVFSPNFVRHLIRAPLKTSLRSWSRRSRTNEFPLYLQNVLVPKAQIGISYDYEFPPLLMVFLCNVSCITM